MSGCPPAALTGSCGATASSRLVADHIAGRSDIRPPDAAPLATPASCLAVAEKTRTATLPDARYLREPEGARTDRAIQLDYPPLIPTVAIDGHLNSGECLPRPNCRRQRPMSEHHVRRRNFRGMAAYELRNGNAS
jgi:hypothetical protein